jgi:hypothetical protein
VTMPCLPELAKGWTSLSSSRRSRVLGHHRGLHPVAERRGGWSSTGVGELRPLVECVDLLQNKIAESVREMRHWIR